MIRTRYTLLLLLLTCTLSLPGFAQRFGMQRRVAQNDPPATELIVARWHFGTNGRIGHMGWSHNYPQSDRHLNDFLARATGVDVEEWSFRLVELGESDVFDYPFAYVSEPGEMELTDQEVIHLREFIARGGFVLMDDFDGPAQWAQMRSQVIRAFPDRDFVAIPAEHAVFTAHTALENLQAMANHVPGGEITYYGLYRDDGSLAIMAGHNNDLANFWDWYADGSMPLKPSTDAFRLGTNAVIYALTH